MLTLLFSPWDPLAQTSVVREGTAQQRWLIEQIELFSTPRPKP
jgi:hypothetical protein